jgi:hypothetical protein
MKQHQQRELDSLRRVQDFLTTNAEAIKPLADTEGRRQLDGAVAQLAVFGDEQGGSDLQMAGQINRERSLTADLKARHMQPIATFARARLRGVPDFAALTRSASGVTGRQLVRAARAMATAGAPHAEALTRGGFPADTIAQLAAAADAVQNALVERANTKVTRVGATKGIQEQLRTGREAVAMLHAVISKQFAGDPTFLAGWRAARRVTSKPGAVRLPAGVVGSATAGAATPTRSGDTAPVALPAAFPPVLSPTVGAGAPVAVR